MKGSTRKEGRPPRGGGARGGHDSPPPRAPSAAPASRREAPGLWCGPLQGGVDKTKGLEGSATLQSGHPGGGVSARIPLVRAGTGHRVQPACHALAVQARPTAPLACGMENTKPISGRWGPKDGRDGLAATWVGVPEKPLDQRLSPAWWAPRQSGVSRLLTQRGRSPGAGRSPSPLPRHPGTDSSGAARRSGLALRWDGARSRPLGQVSPHQPCVDSSNF